MARYGWQLIPGCQQPKDGESELEPGGRVVAVGKRPEAEGGEDHAEKGRGDAIPAGEHDSEEYPALKHSRSRKGVSRTRCSGAPPLSSLRRCPTDCLGSGAGSLPKSSGIVPDPIQALGARNWVFGFEPRYRLWGGSLAMQKVVDLGAGALA